MKSVALKPPPPLKGKLITSSWYSPECGGNDETINWYVYAAKKNPVLRHLINAVIENLKAEYYKSVVKELPCSSEAKARVLHTTGSRALTLALGLIPADLEKWVEESTYTSDRENPIALDGAVKYEEETDQRISEEDSNHYTNNINAPLTSQTLYSTSQQRYIRFGDQQWDVVIFAPDVPPR